MAGTEDSGQSAGTIIKFIPDNGTDTNIIGGVNESIKTKLMVITGMEECNTRSIEELRIEDYFANRKGVHQDQDFVIGQIGQENKFGSQPASSWFSQSSTDGGLFGSKPSENKPPFGATQTFDFGTSKSSFFGFPNPSPFDKLSAAGSPVFSLDKTSENKSNVFKFGSKSSSAPSLFVTSTVATRSRSNLGSPGFNFSNMNLRVNPFSFKQMEPTKYSYEARCQACDVSLSNRGFGDNKNIFGKLSIGSLERRLIFRNLNLGPWYTEELVNMKNMGMEGFYGICFISSLREKIAPLEMVLAISEAIMPGVPDEMFFTESEARNEFVKVIQENWEDIISNNDWAKSIQNRTKELDCFYNSEPTRKSTITFTTDIKVLKEDLLQHTAMELLQIIIQGTKECVKQRWRSWIVVAMIACAKRGQVTPKWIANLMQQTYSTLDKVVPALDETVSLMWEAFNFYITENNAEEVFTRWAGLLPPESSFLRGMLIQTKGAGLNALETVIRAVRDFQDFPWKRVNDIFPKTFKNFLAAVEAVDGNRYYGFKRDIGPANGSFFRNIVWVAKTLEVEINNDIALNDDKEWQPSAAVKNDDRLVALINEYVLFKVCGQALTKPLDQKEIEFSAAFVREIERYGPLE